MHVLQGEREKEREREKDEVETKPLITIFQGEPPPPTATATNERTNQPTKALRGSFDLSRSGRPWKEGPYWVQARKVIDHATGCFQGGAKGLQIKKIEHDKFDIRFWILTH